MSESDAEPRTARLDTSRRRRLRENWKTQPSQIPLRPFIDYAWDNYDPKAVVSHLMDADRSFYRHKSILHEGFCAWVACPSHNKLCHDGMVYRIAKAVEDAEAPWREKASTFSKLVGETVGRTIRADRRFFEEAYYSIGGPTRILRSMSRVTFKRTLLEHATDMLEAVHLMALHHYHLTHLQDKKTYHVPSKDAGAALVKKAFGSPVSRLFVEELRVKDTANPPGKREPDGKILKQYKLRGDTSIIASWHLSRPAVAYAYAAAGAPGNNTGLQTQENLGFDLGTDWTPVEGLRLSVTGFYEIFRNEL
ncbi:hypothetical protein FV232_27625, partial [Methylobacterium sp. WL30]|uniref:hypothetical protein n=1 Tax=Methylobacterium sp. WL30 TaxID=2603895 RepID=UPI0011C8BE54